MQVTFASWTSFVALVVGLLISAAIIIGAGRGAVWALKRIVGDHNFPALTMLLAVAGGLGALYSTLSGPSERGEEKARTLTFATDIASQNLNLISFGDKYTGEISDVQKVDPALLRFKIARLESMTRALNDLPVTSLPSAASMSALVRSRAASTSILIHANQAVSANQPADFEVDVVELMSGIETLRSERDRLYPMYKIGRVVVGKLPQQR